MKKLSTIIASIFIASNLNAQTFNSENISWFSGKNFTSEGHSSSRVRYDNTLKKFRYTELLQPISGTNWYHFSSILHGGGDIRFLTHQSWNTIAPGMAADGTFDPNQFAQNFTRMIIAANGNIGIGTTNPTEKLHVNNGNIIMTGGNSTLTNESNIFFGDRTIYLKAFYNTSSYKGLEIGQRLRIGNNFTGYLNDFNLLVPGTAMIKRLSIEEKLYVGTKNQINTSMGNFTMVVDGKLGAREIEVKTGSWADYVFDNNYNLKSLSEVESFIKQNKHLPNVPSETQVIEHGFSIADMAKIQMEKIEELTLYTIQQQKLIEQLINEVEALKKK